MGFFERRRRQKRLDTCRDLLRADIEISNGETQGQCEGLTWYFGDVLRVTVPLDGWSRRRIFMVYEYRTLIAAKETCFDAITELLEQA